MIMYYEVSKNGEVIHTSDFTTGICKEDGNDVFEELFKIENAKEFESHPQLDDFIDCATNLMIQDLLNDDMEVYFSFCNEDKELSHSLVMDKDGCGIIDWKAHGGTFKAMENPNYHSCIPHIEERNQYVIPIETFEYTNSFGHDFKMKTKLYITKLFDEKSNGWYWDVWVGADTYGYRENIFTVPVSEFSLEQVVEIGIDDYYECQAFQDYVREIE